MKNILLALVSVLAIATPTLGLDIEVQLGETCIKEVCTDIGEENLLAVKKYYSQYGINIEFNKTYVYYLGETKVTLPHSVNGNIDVLGTMFWINRQLPESNADINWINIGIDGGRFLGVGASMTKSMITNSELNNHYEPTIVQHVIKHELAHVLCLPHIEKKSNLMRHELKLDGTDGDKLTRSQVKTIKRCMKK